MGRRIRSPNSIGGSGKQACTRRAAALAAIDCFSIQTNSAYSVEDFREDLKALLSARFNGSNALLKLCDEALQASVLAAPR